MALPIPQVVQEIITDMQRKGLSCVTITQDRMKKRHRAFRWKGDREKAFKAEAERRGLYVFDMQNVWLLSYDHDHTPLN